MGKSKKKRDHSNSSKKSRERKAKSRSKSRSRDKHRKKSSSNENNGRLLEGQHKSLSGFKYKYCLLNQSKSMGVAHAVCNLCINYAQRPRLILILTQSMPQLMSIRMAYKLNRPYKVIDENSHNKQLHAVVKQSKAEILMTTQKKMSILMALEQSKKIFDVIILTAFCYEAQFYLKLTESLRQKGHIVIFSDNAPKVSKLSESLGVQFEQVNGMVSQEQIQKQLLSDIQYAPRSSSSTLQKIKSLPFSLEEIACKLLEMERHRRQPIKSLHLAMAGYVTYRLDMDVEFNSLKYVWNFLREEFPKNLYEQIRGMHKYENEKGVVFNIPEQLRYLGEVMSEKLKRHRSKYKGIDFEECGSLPELQDIESQEYKLLKEKKKLALDNKNELQIFIGGVPYEMDQNTLKAFFKQHDVNLFLVRILKDQKGFSKGIGFGLCENKQHFERAAKLNGSTLIDRTIRIRLADQRKL